MGANLTVFIPAWNMSRRKVVPYCLLLPLRCEFQNGHADENARGCQEILRRETDDALHCRGDWRRLFEAARGLDKEYRCHYCARAAVDAQEKCVPDDCGDE